MSRVLAFAISAIITVFALLSSNASAHPAWGIAVDGQGQVYFSDLKNIWKIDAQGKLSVFRAGTDHTHDLNIDGAGNVYGAENSYDPETKRFFSAIWKMTPAGVSSYLLAPTVNPPKGTSIWKDRDGNMYHFTNYSKSELLVLKRTPNGNVSALVGSSNALRNYRQNSPTSSGGTALGTDGALYFTNGSNVYKLTKSGTLIQLARNLVKENSKEKRTGGTSLFGIAVDAQENAFVADFGNQCVLKVTPDKQITKLIRAEESWFPTGVAVSGNDLYILENNFTKTSTPIGTRVRKLSPDGKISVIAAAGENTSQPTRVTPLDTSIEPVVPLKGFDPYVLVGLVAGVLALSSVIWQIRKKKVNDYQRKLPSN